MNKVKQVGRVKVNPEFKNLVRRLKRPPLTTGWHCYKFNYHPVAAPHDPELPLAHSMLFPVFTEWWWIASDPAYILWTKYNKQYKAWKAITKGIKINE